MAKKVLIIGDTIIDVDLEVKAIGLALDSPTLKTSFVSKSRSFGGAANVAKFAAFFGLDVTFATTMHPQSAEDFLTQQKGGKMEVVNLNREVESWKTRFYVSHGDARYKHLQINNTPSDPYDINWDVDMSLFDVVAFSDYRCGVIRPFMIDQSIQSSAITFGASQVSSHVSNLSNYSGLDTIVCNEKEAQTFSRRKDVVITKGRHGAELNGVDYPAHTVDSVSNVIGAGDCFYAALLASGNVAHANNCAAKYVRGDYDRSF